MGAAITPADAIARARESDRVLIVGAPGSGKTTLANLVGRDDTLHTDDLLLDIPWDAQRAAVVEWATPRTRWLIEGVTASRCLRHGELDATLVLFLPEVHADRGKRAVVLGKSVASWIAQGFGALAPGVFVQVRGPLPTEAC